MGDLGLKSHLSPEKRRIDLATPGLVVQLVIHNTTALLGSKQKVTKVVLCKK